MFSYLLEADTFSGIVAYFFSCFHSIPQVAQRMRLSGNAVFFVLSIVQCASTVGVGVVLVIWMPHDILSVCLLCPGRFLSSGC